MAIQYTYISGYYSLNVQEAKSYSCSIGRLFINDGFLFVLWITLIGLFILSIIRLATLIILNKYHFEKTQKINYDTREVGVFLRYFSVAGRLLEHITIMYGICQLSSYMSKTPDNKKELRSIFSCKETKKHGLYIWKKCNLECLNSSPNSGPHWCILILLLITVTIFFLAYAGISITPGIILMVYRKALVTAYENNTNIAIIYIITASFNYVGNLIARLAMVVTTLAVGNAWINLLLRENQSTEDLQKGYKTTGQAVVAIQRVFQEWFVIKWIIYFIDITAYSIIAIKSIFDNKEVKKDDVIMYSFIRLSYNFIAFLTLYICGTIMNKYHEKCCKKLEKKLMKHEATCTTEHTRLKIQWDIQCAIASLRKPKYCFSPSLCGLSIPLNSSGYTLSILIALFAFIANYISTL